MDVAERIRQLLAEAEDLERRARKAYWEAKDSDYRYDQDWKFEKEAEYARMARACREEAAALTKAHQEKKDDGPD